MFEIIIIAVIIIFVIRKKKENGAGGGRFGSTRDTIQTTTAPAHRMPRPGHAPVPPTPHNTMPFGSSAKQNTMPSGSSSQQNPAIPVSVRQEEATGSTTAYLNEKARQDAIEHAREDREEEMRLKKAYGGLRVAERLYEGDSVPQGRKLCVCGYCGAENLLPMMAREQFCCYFCREPLA